VDTNFLISVASVLGSLILLLRVSWKGSAQRIGAMHVRPEHSEINFALPEGHTVVGVIDTKKGMYFVIGNEVRNEKSYE